MKIIELTTTQHYNYKDFILKGLKTHPDAFRISPQDELNEPFPTLGNSHSFTLGALDEQDKLAGVVSFKTEIANREKLAHKGLLFRMYVGASHSGKGIGKQLMKKLIERVKELPDIEQINLTVVASNNRAVGLYKSFGFEPFSLERKAIKSNDYYLDEYTMVLFLRG
ncbi:MAG: GNAT family N-acetyltransferase [Mucilaginibacter sp.]